ncbi:MAG TPA: glutamine-hydrolyzing GMP synthase [Halanaerobiaceae bacterium]|jgi:GMP synthase (glutamine-hydrolysing)|nr:glutamine-hydrolyzing GMP synthase [Bacillota bacterium]HHU92297.1 glutamine-hydrolyzing GMP synthase [Halanaerobiaceae bacterium]HOA41055.1 glutamine-hydrolyzing GMP synthase [Halanaerobiales bacterium]HPZ63192.1 glutamine-hydrolyzing GMP synthase [Halanaerobiales bacterium]HQD04276.1 glutamine-hydrolyzing GMP synthase [Halanaerobiales bacterium]
MQQEDILVLEPGGGKSQILARMVREAQVYSHILPYKVDLARIRKINPAGIILAGSREELSALDPSRLEELSELGIPVMDFQPEELETEKGRELIQDFLFKVCQLKANWNMENFIKKEIEKIREEVGSARVISGLSGGVDSAVASALVHKAIGDQLICIFVDHGMLRKGEAEEVRKTFAGQFKIPLIYVDARKRFLDKLAGVVDPEQKRKIIGEEFIRVFEEEAEKIGDASFLVQGTLYSDVIESGDGNDVKVKSHHNVGGLPEDMDLDLIEPLRDLFKDEVRKLGELLGLPEEIVWRQPFPGPGLAVRIIGSIDEEKLSILREADAIFREEIREAGLSREIWQYFAVLPDIKSVGVRDNQRTYAYPVILRAVSSRDAMTADWSRIPYDLLEKISSRIIREVEAVNRVVYDITSKPPGTIEWE